jgi:hypothetical protein
MGRKLFTLAAAISALLCAATLLLWTLSYAHALRWDQYAAGGYRSIMLDCGSIVLTTGSADPAATTSWRFWQAPPRNWGGPHLSEDGSSFGFGHAESSWTPPGGGQAQFQREWWAPYWFPAVLTAVLPTIWIWRRLRPALGASIVRRWPAFAAGPPMRRSQRVLTCAAAICLALALATCALWVRSFRRTDYLRFGGPARPFVVWSAGGRLVANAGAAHESGRTGWQWRTYREYDDNPWERYIPGVAARKLAWGDFGYVQGSYPVTGAPAGRPARERFRMIVFPGWLPAILLALLPAWWFPRRWREFRARWRAGRNVCARCAYDLRGNTSGVCPECGTPAVQTAAG